MHKIDISKLPAHIAIIMDGNGRWAKRNALQRIAGHRQGAETVRTVVRTCRELGIRYLTLYAFSVENWLRPLSEVAALMFLLERYLHSENQEMMEGNIRLRTIGDIDSLPEKTRNMLLETVRKTSGNTGMVLTLALSYGGRDDILTAVRMIAGKIESGEMRSEEITKELFSQFLATAEMPDPDLLIRTSGECRISNFLLWQSAYTEFYFTDTLWPEFSKEGLIEAIIDYQRRERRFGLVGDQAEEIFKE